MFVGLRSINVFERFTEDVDVYLAHLLFAMEISIRKQMHSVMYLTLPNLAMTINYRAKQKYIT